MFFTIKYTTVNTKVVKFLEGLVILSLVATSVGMTPNLSLDPMNQARALIIITLGFTVLGIIVSKGSLYLLKINRILLLVLIMFVIQLTLTLLFSKDKIQTQLFGTFARNTGYLSYFSLVMLLIGAYLISSRNFLSRILITINFVWFLSIFYSIIQAFGKDPMPWQNKYSPIIGFLGNPNFQSSFLGIASVSAVSQILDTKNSKLKRLILSVSIIVSISLVIKSNSVQGIIVFLVGLYLVVYLYLRNSQKYSSRLIRVIYIIIGLIFFVIIILGSLNHGILSSYLYQDSVRQRGFYWRAALLMLKDHPFFGVGLDGYGNYYYQYRSLRAAQLTPDINSNAAHNVILDFAANGGVFMVLAYLCLISYTLYSLMNHLRKNSKIEPALIGVVGIWIAYQAQTLISINHLGLAIWGWVTMGLILGINRGHQIDEKVGNRRKGSKNFGIRIGLMLGVLGFTLAGWSFTTDMNLKSALDSNQLNKIMSAAEKQPIQEETLVIAISRLANSNFVDQAMILTQILVENYPRSYNGWSFKKSFSNPGSPEYVEAVKNLNQLDPNRKQS